MTNLNVNFCGVEFSNPTVLASGVLGVTAASLCRVVASGAGGVTTKSIWLTEHRGHKNPTMFGTEHYFMNAVGLSDAGIEKAREVLEEYCTGGEVGELAKGKSADGASGASGGSKGSKVGLSGKSSRPAPLIASIVAGKQSEFAELAEKILSFGQGLEPDIIEINISCPNVEDEFGVPFACDLLKAADVVGVVRGKLDEIGSKVPMIVKLSPNVPNIGRIAKACADAGADGFCAINTVGPGMAIDLKTRMPLLANRVGGVSGPGIKPVAVRCVNDIWRATGLPIIGTGGVLTGEDAIEMMMAGATLVGMGTMVYYRGVEGFGEVVREISDWCEANGVKDVKEIIGRVRDLSRG